MKLRMLAPLLALLVLSGGAQASPKPNILFIAIDDLNDWVGPLGGNPQARTPNMDNFCKDGAMIFKNAVCAAPICCPSRSAILSGFMPNRTGIYNNGQNMIYTDVVKTHATLPEYFTQHGYYSLSDGKIFHKHGTELGTDFGHWAFDEFNNSRKNVDNKADKKKFTSGHGTINGESKPEYKSKAKISWGPCTTPYEETVDYLVADWTRKQLMKPRDKPFFLASGIIKPHLPWIVPQKFFDLYDLDTIVTPKFKLDDLDDILNPDGKPAFKPSVEYEWITRHGLEKEATRAYLANISYADSCLGIILDSLEKSGHADDTIVVIWGDNGWHLGEKLRYLKNTLWSESVRIPFFVRVPGMKGATYCDATVSLSDIFPTLVSLCGLPKKAEIDGHDLSPLLANPKADWAYPGVTVSENGTSVLTKEWHYISNLSGARELYKVGADPMEWTNLINNPEYRDIVAELDKSVPKERVKVKLPHFDKAEDYVSAPPDPTLKPTRDLSTLK